MLFIIKIIDYLVMKLTESEVKELVKAALREAFINEGFTLKENVNNDWWTSVAYLQTPGDCEEFDRMQEEGNYKGILRLAREYDFSGENGIDFAETYFGSPAPYRGDDILDSDENYAVVYNNSVGGTYNIMLKITSEELSNAIQNASEQDLYYASEDVKNFIKQNGDE